jgi:ornithine--oxo-acid transaminase
VKGSSKATVKNTSPKSKKSPKKLALEEIIEEESNEIEVVPQAKSAKTSKGKKGKKGKQAKVEEIKEVENIKTNVRAKKGKKASLKSQLQPEKSAKPPKKQVLPDDISKFSPEQLNLENIKLGNRYASTPINYELKSEKGAENPYETYMLTRSSIYTKSFIQTERQYTCYNYAPLPVVLESGNGVYVQDVDKHIYIDFLSGYSSLNFGHCNKEILNSVIPSMSTLHMTSRAFHNNLIGSVSQTLANMFDLDKVLFMNSGVEAGESAIKFARRWGYRKKGIPDDQAEVIFFAGNFWGRTIAACASSDDKSRYNQFGPFKGLGFHIIPYDDVEALENALQSNPNVCGVFLEPIQGENGVIIPHEDYLSNVRHLCSKYNALMIVDEIQTAFGRGAANSTVCRSKNIRPDLLLLGKSLSAGFYPVSAVVGKNEVMDLIRPGEHGSTYGGNPLALKFTHSTLNYLVNNRILHDVGIKEGIFSSYLTFNSKFIREIRGRGMLFAIEVFPDSPVSANDVSLYLMERGLLCKPTKSNILR